MSLLNHINTKATVLRKLPVEEEVEGIVLSVGEEVEGVELFVGKELQS